MRSNDTNTGASPKELLRATAKITTSYLERNRLTAGQLSGFVERVGIALSGVTGSPLRLKEPVPAVDIANSVHRDGIVCLECGHKLSSIGQHLKKFHGLRPDEYRAKWGLPDNYPLVCETTKEKRLAAYLKTRNSSKKHAEILSAAEFKTGGTRRAPSGRRTKAARKKTAEKKRTPPSGGVRFSESGREKTQDAVSGPVAA